MNPYASTGSVATVTASVAGKDSLGGPGGPNDVSASNMSTGEVTRRLLGYVRPYWALLAASLLSAVVGVTLQLYVPILIGRGIDCMVCAGAVDFGLLMPIVRELALVVIVASALQWVQGYCVNRLSYETVRDLRNAASDKLDRMPLSFIDSHPHGDLISRVVNDVDQVGDGLLQGTNQLLGGVVTIVGTLGFMLATSVPMALVVVLVTPLSVGASPTRASRTSSESRASSALTSSSTSASSASLTPSPMAPRRARDSTPSTRGSTRLASTHSS